VIFVPDAPALRQLIEQADPGTADADPEVEDGDEVRLADWRRLFPSPRRAADRGVLDFEVYGDDWFPDFPADVFERVSEALDGGDVGEAVEAPCGEPGRHHRCAWYLPLHASAKSWGIYLRETCILDRMPQIAAGLSAPALSVPLLKSLYRAAAFGLFLHEQFHHKIESLALRLLIVENRLRYPTYDRAVYQKVRGTDDCLEEALANADAYRRMTEAAYATWIGNSVTGAAKQRLSQSWRRSPAGYRKAGSYVASAPYRDALALLEAQLHEGKRTPSRVAEWRHAANMHESLFSVTSNVYTVIPVGATPVMPLR